MICLGFVRLLCCLVVCLGLLVRGVIDSSGVAGLGGGYMVLV